MMSKTYYVYILASSRNGTLYIGVTNNLMRRMFEHKHDLLSSFTKKYAIHQLAYYETTNSVDAAILREKQIKNWNRVWKLRLIEKQNPFWKDLACSWIPD